MPGFLFYLAPSFTGGPSTPTRLAVAVTATMFSLRAGSQGEEKEEKEEKGSGAFFISREEKGSGRKGVRSFFYFKKLAESAPSADNC